MDNSNIQIKAELEGLITQWTHFSSYVKKLDTEHWQVFTIVFAAFGLFSFAKGQDGTASQFVAVICWIIPLTVMVLFYYEAYRLREVSLMKGYLTVLETMINIKLSILKKSSPEQTSTTNTFDGSIDKSKKTTVDSVATLLTKPSDHDTLFKWFCSYETVFMTNNNLANTFFPIAVLLVCIVILRMTFVLGIRSMADNSCEINIYRFVFILSVVLDIFACFSVFRNMRATFFAINDDIDDKRREYYKYYIKYYKKRTFRYWKPNSLKKLKGDEERAEEKVEGRREERAEEKLEGRREERAEEKLEGKEEKNLTKAVYNNDL